MRFFDCNTYIGKPANGGCGASAGELLAAMDRAGIERALVWHVAQRDADPATGNGLLADAIAGNDRLTGCWTLLPPQTGELGSPADWFARAGRANVRAFRAWPKENRYLLRAETMGEVLTHMVAARLPLILSVPAAVEWPELYDLMSAWPELTVICADVGCWGTDRLFRPLIERYPSVYVEISGYFVDGGIEDFVWRYGPGRLLFGTNFPAAYHGAMMLALARAEIDDDAKRAIAAGNLQRLLDRASP